MSKSNEIKKTVYTLHNLIVKAYNANEESNLFYNPATITKQIDDYSSMLASLLNVSPVPASVLLPASVSVSFKGAIATKDKPQTLNATVKVKSPTTIKKAFLNNLWNMLSEELTIKEEPKKEKKEKLPETAEEKRARMAYNFARNMAKIDYEETHLPDGTSKENGAKEEFTFPTLKEWKEQKVA
jgi:hypothetical protein